jgi:hypothetical protein
LVIAGGRIVYVGDLRGILLSPRKAIARYLGGWLILRKEGIYFRWHRLVVILAKYLRNI